MSLIKSELRKVLYVRANWGILLAVRGHLDNFGCNYTVYF